MVSLIDRTLDSGTGDLRAERLTHGRYDRSGDCSWYPELDTLLATSRERLTGTSLHPEPSSNPLIQNFDVFINNSLRVCQYARVLVGTQKSVFDPPTGRFHFRNFFFFLNSGQLSRLDGCKMDRPSGLPEPYKTIDDSGKRQPYISIRLPADSNFWTILTLDKLIHHFRNWFHA